MLQLLHCQSCIVSLLQLSLVAHLHLQPQKDGHSTSLLSHGKPTCTQATKPYASSCTARTHTHMHWLEHLAGGRVVLATLANVTAVYCNTACGCCSVASASNAMPIQARWVPAHTLHKHIPMGGAVARHCPGQLGGTEAPPYHTSKAPAYAKATTDSKSW